MGTARPTTGSASDQGRRRYNADALAVWAHGGGLGVAVADGIGDTAAAYGAAHVAADTAARAAAGGGALDALLAARAAIVGGRDTRAGDAVLVVAALRAGGGEIAWVGDCRAYFFDGAGVRQLTADQTMAAAVREAGVATPPPRWEHVVTASVRSASAANGGAGADPGRGGQAGARHRRGAPGALPRGDRGGAGPRPRPGHGGAGAHRPRPAGRGRRQRERHGRRGAAGACAARPAHRHRPGVPRGGPGKPPTPPDRESPFPRRRVSVSATASLRFRDGESPFSGWRRPDTGCRLSQRRGNARAYGRGGGSGGEALLGDPQVDREVGARGRVGGEVEVAAAGAAAAVGPQRRAPSASSSRAAASAASRVG